MLPQPKRILVGFKSVCATISVISDKTIVVVQKYIILARFEEQRYHKLHWHDDHVDFPHIR